MKNIFVLDILKVGIFASIATCFATSNTLGNWEPEIEDGAKLLFIGNSFTGNLGGLHNYVELGMASANPPLNVTALPPPNGYFFGQGLGSMFTTEVRNAIQTENFDVVQITSGGTSTIEDFHEVISASGAKTLVYMTWASNPARPGGSWESYRSSTQSNISTMRSLEDDLGVLVAPVGAVYYDLLIDPVRDDFVREDYLYEPRNIHQDTLGTLVNAYTVYSILTGRSPVGIKFDFPKFVDGETLWATNVGYYDYAFDDDLRHDVQSRVWEAVKAWKAETFTLKPLTIADSNQLPVASYSASAVTGVVPFTINFDASTSSDPDDDSLTYEWDFGSGNFAAGTATTSHTFEDRGTYYVGVRVSDGSRTDTYFRRIDLYAPGENRPPLVTLSASQTESFAPATLLLDASASTDPDGDTLSYEWDFGIEEGFVGGTATEWVSFDTSGDYTVKVRVSDGELSTVATQKITISRGRGTYYRLNVAEMVDVVMNDALDGRVAELDWLEGSVEYPLEHMTSRIDAVNLDSEGNNPWRAYDGREDRFWDFLGITGISALYLGHTTVAADSLRIQTTEADRSFKAFKAYGSHDGLVWTEIASVSNQTTANWGNLTRTFPLTAIPDTEPEITTPLLADANVGLPYDHAITALQGNGILEWVVSSGALPDGITLTAEGHLQGTPTALGTYNFSLTATDVDGDSDSASFSLAVVQGPVFGPISNDAKLSEHGWIWDAPYPFIYLFTPSAFAWVVPDATPESIFLFVFTNDGGFWAWTGAGYGPWFYVFDETAPGWQYWY